MLYNSKIHRLAVLSALLFLVVSAVFIACKKDEDGQDNGNTSTTEITVSIFGSVRDGNGVALSGVTLKAGTSTITSDANGLFILEKVKVPKGRYYVSAERSGYFDGGRGGLAKEGEYYSVNIVMLSRGTAANLNAATGGVVITANNSSLTFPTGAIVTAAGQAYTGNVKIYTQHLSPDAAGFAERVPGGDLACRNVNGELSPLESYGMMGVELEDNSGNPLKIATGKTVSVRFPIAPSQLATSPSSIPLLSFDAEKGEWVQEGTAIKNGNFYEGVVSHFSWWNVDVISPPPPIISGSVVDCNNNPLASVTVTVNGQFTFVTNAQGQYSSWISPGTHTLQVLSSNNGGILSSNAVTVTATTGTIQVPVLTVSCPAYVTAQAVDCNSNNTAGYGRAVWSGGFSSVQYSSTGSFQFAVPANQSITVQVFNGQSNSTTINSGNLNTAVFAGNITLCNQVGSCVGGPSTVTDIDGNVYNVVQIGNQCWMKENLKTTKYRNGASIPGNLSDSAWIFIVSGAQADRNNDPTNTAVYGKLYNWYAVADPAGLCPTGWHVPGVGEWNEMVKFLDPGADTSIFGPSVLVPQSQIAGGFMKATGTLQAGTGLWLDPNVGATNSSGFTGLPGGFRGGNGAFDLVGNGGYWWSSTQFSSTIAWGHFVYYNYAVVSRYLVDLRDGRSVRCVRD